MAAIDLPYINAFKSRNRVFYYYRRSGQKIRIRDERGNNLTPSDPAFLAAYYAIHETFGEPQPRGETVKGSLAHVIDEYRKSPDFKGLSDKTRRDYGRYLDLLKEKHGKNKVAAMPREFVLGLRDKYQNTPRKANYVIQVLRLVLSYAEDRPSTFALPRNWQNPARRPKLLKTGDGHRPWEEFEIKAFRKAWGHGTLERTAFELALNTGQRGQDIIKMARFHIRDDGDISVAQEKTGTRLDIPQTQDLRETLRKWFKTHKHVMLLTGTKGAPFKVDHFRHVMRDAYRDAGLPEDCTTHGLRYTAATILREEGCEWPTVAAITGHETAEMARKYSEKKRRAQVAVTKLNAASKKRKKNKTDGQGD